MSDLASALGDLKGLRANSTPVPLPAPPAPVRAPQGASSEQASVVACPARCIRLVALAGTGKTETLAAYARARSRARLRYVAFNKAMAEAAIDRMPPNVTTSTFHALAFSRYGASTAHKTRLSWDMDRVSSWVGRPVTSMLAPAALELVKGAVDRFLASASRTLDASHVPLENWLVWSALDPNHTVFSDPEEVAQAAVRLWRTMLDPESSCPITPDAWVKLAQLGEWVPPSDGWLIDEAQDLSPAMLAWVRIQPGLQVSAGDPHQSIYGFRTPPAWAREAPPEGEVRLHLTHSFRFGEAIAEEVNRILTRLGAAERIIGAGSAGVVAHGPPRAAATALARSQAGAWAWARRAPSEGWAVATTPRPPVRWASVAALRRGDRAAIEDPWVLGFESYSALREASSGWSREWAAAFAYAENLAEVSFSTEGVPLDLLTVHQAKGLTLETVWLGPDFRLPFGSCAAWSTEEAEEARIAYVAASRARAALHLHPRLVDRWEAWLASQTAPALPADAKSLLDDGF